MSIIFADDCPPEPAYIAPPQKKIFQKELPVQAPVVAPKECDPFTGLPFNCEMTYLPYNVRVFDFGPRFEDRYMVIFDRDHKGKEDDRIYCMSESPEEDGICHYEGQNGEIRPPKNAHVFQSHQIEAGYHLRLSDLERERMIVVVRRIPQAVYNKIEMLK